MVTVGAQQGLESPDALRSDHLVVAGVRLPYQNFNRNPMGWCLTSSRRSSNSYFFRLFTIRMARPRAFKDHLIMHANSSRVHLPGKTATNGTTADGTLFRLGFLNVFLTIETIRSNLSA